MLRFESVTKKYKLLDLLDHLIIISDTQHTEAQSVIFFLCSV